MSRHFLVLLPFVAACAGVDDDRPGIQIGDEGAFGCSVLSVEDVTDPAATIDALRASANDVTSGLSGSFSGAGTTHDGVTVDPLTLDVGAASELVWVETGHDGAPSADCDPYLSGAVAVGLDGGDTVSASLDGWLSVAPGDRVLLWAAAPYDTVQGDLDPLWLDPATLDWTELQVIASPAEGGWDGVAGFTGCNEGDGAECAPPVDAGGEAAELVFSVR